MQVLHVSNCFRRKGKCCVVLLHEKDSRGSSDCSGDKMHVEGEKKRINGECEADTCLKPDSYYFTT